MTRPMPRKAEQPDAKPTNKLVVGVGGSVTIFPVAYAAVAEVWPQIAPAALAGEAATAFVAVLFSAAMAFGAAYFVRDRTNVPKE